MAQNISKGSPYSSDQGIAPDPHCKLEPGLYLTATPIGNLRDITLRALDALAACDLILCEDTRVTRKLLSAFAIARPLKAYHDHNGAKVRPGIIRRLKAGAAICLVSDAGTPLISDPGYQLVKACRDEGIAVTVLPGACAALAGLALSGLPPDRFLFLGFLPPKKGARTRILDEVKGLRATLVIYEAANRLAATLAALETQLGTRQAAVARELTKRFEEVREGSLGVLAAHYEEAGSPKGEVVIVVGPAQGGAGGEVDVAAALGQALESMSTKDAAAAIAERAGLPRKAVYELALKLQREGSR